MLPLGFASILVGAIAMVAGIKGSSIAGVAKGKPDEKNKDTPGGSGGSSATPAEAAAAGPAATGRNAPAPSAAGAAVKASGAVRLEAEKAYVQKLAKAKGWDAAAWEGVIEAESGWSSTAENASGAFGIGEFLGATKSEYAKYGSESTDPLDQIVAMSDYIESRYGNPTKALEHENAYHWY